MRAVAVVAVVSRATAVLMVEQLSNPPLCGKSVATCLVRAISKRLFWFPSLPCLLLLYKHNKQALHLARGHRSVRHVTTYNSISCFSGKMTPPTPEALQEQCML